ncbi:hypothetical protein C8A00DRAFT_46276 [Chaetomidium leptoderma]|uniref:Uncharacterized protein n=1 Tax=Chaetomidium leptoderma TaxID=669021 RepID=A0AAN6VFF9_9PEZI|nr:hypothetical protein C8A00DRAFT_46276 [Chaetomidium leptoderma]
MAQFSLLGKTAVVTGASGGIGFAIASRFAYEGANVVLAGRTHSKLEHSLERLREIEIKPEQATLKPQAHSTHCFDVREMQAWKGLVKAHPTVDVLVNCAGQTQGSLLLTMSEERIQDQLSSNLSSVIWGCKTVGRQMKSQQIRGCIINVSSLLAYRAVIGTSVYAATKAGQLGLTTALSQEFARHGIRVNAVVPGYIDTEMTQDIANKDQLLKRIPLGRFGTPIEVADAAAFLAKNEYANNCILNLDGGLSAV